MDDIQRPDPLDEDVTQQIQRQGGVDPKDEAGNVGEALRQDPGNLGGDIGGAADLTYPDPQVSDKTM